MCRKTMCREKAIGNIISLFQDKKKDILLELKKKETKKEKCLKQVLYSNFGWTKQKDRKYEGMFGWKEFKTDRCVKIDDQLVILEVKKVTSKKEYGYWHAAIQGCLYNYLEAKKKIKEDTPACNWFILCIVLDYGRKKGQLSDLEKEFLDHFKCMNVYFIRINMKCNTIEHNLKSCWAIIDP